MKVGKISESVLKRSVLKQIKCINDDMKNGAGVGSDCAIFSYKSGCIASSVATFFLQEAEDIRYPIYKAANNVACSGAIPKTVLLTLLFPANAEERELAEIMKAATRVAGELQIQIAGGHTACTDSVKTAYVTATVTGELPAEDMVSAAGAVAATCTGRKAVPQTDRKAVPGEDIVISKWVGLEGTALLAKRHGKELVERYPLHMIEEAADFEKYLSIIPEAATAEKSNVSTMHDVSTGGIFAALWELAESAGVGLNIDLKKIPIRQETVEVCEFFGISPYELLSGGSLLMTAKNGEDLVQVLSRQGIPAAVIGKVTGDNDRVVINEEEKRFLERPKTDEILKIEKEM